MILNSENKTQNFDIDAQLIFSMSPSFLVYVCIDDFKIALLVLQLYPLIVEFITGLW
jgi:hypothetical protein